MKSLLVLAFACVLPAPAAADCAMMGLAPQVLTAPDAALATDGGVVVASMSVERGHLADGDVAIQPAWRFVAASGTLRPAIQSLAPGLAVYRTTTAEPVELRDGAGGVRIEVTRAGEQPRLAAPKVKTLRYDAPISRRSVQRVEVTLDGEPPPGALALVLADAKGRPRSWGTVAGTVLYPYNQRACDAMPNGTIPSRTGDRVTLFWVDAHGRKSASTRPLRIR